jgi:hypothetical protein
MRLKLQRDFRDFALETLVKQGKGHKGERKACWGKGRRGEGRNGMEGKGRHSNKPVLVINGRMHTFSCRFDGLCD